MDKTITKTSTNKKHEQMLHPVLKTKGTTDLIGLFDQLRAITVIETEKLESEALALILKGHSHTTVANLLNKNKNSSGTITYHDVKIFIQKYRDTFQKLGTQRDSRLMKTYLENRGNLMGELADLAFATKSLITDYKMEKDNLSTIAAVKTLNTILMNYAKLEGFTDEKPNVNVTMKFDKLVQNSDMAPDEFSKKLLDNSEKILEVDFNVIDEVEIIKAEDGKRVGQDNSKGLRQDSE